MMYVHTTAPRGKIVLGEGTMELELGVELLPTAKHSQSSSPVFMLSVRGGDPGNVM
jgi:hypothetical protein